ncbi:hypothetical protein BH10PSE16_BH10PSE16_25800 [soil metagenome]
MDTKIIKGKSPLANDGDILAELEKNTARSLGGKRMLIGVRNDAGEIYRTVKADGIDSFLAAVTIFQNLGMVNELQSLTCVQDGFNAIFQPGRVPMPKPVEGEPLSASVGI